MGKETMINNIRKINTFIFESNLDVRQKSELMKTLRRCEILTRNADPESQVFNPDKEFEQMVCMGCFKLIQDCICERN